MEILVLPLMFVTLVTSSLVVLTSNSWMVMWIALEMNTLSFCMILTAGAIQQKRMVEASMKYFIIQSTASAVMIMYLSTPIQITMTKILFMSGTAAILTKLASAPFHGWFLEIIPKISIKASTILMTWQKLAPIFILMYMMKTAIFISILMSSILGSFMQMIKNKLLEIMALSSIFNLSWMMLAVIISTKCLLTFVFIYWSILISVMFMFSSYKMMNSSVNLSNSINPWTTTILMAGLAGLPPTLGFYAKLQVTIQALKLSMSKLVTILMVVSATNFYIYLRMVSPGLVISPAQSQKNQEKNKKMMAVALLSNLLPLLVFII